jgi:hypothetical protein
VHSNLSRTSVLSTAASASFQVNVVGAYGCSNVLSRRSNEGERLRARRPSVGYNRPKENGPGDGIVENRGVRKACR